MIAGHYATALVPEKTPSASQLAFFLVASQLPDLAWFALTFLGLAPVHTHAGPAHLELIVTHDLLPTLPWVGLAALAGRALFGDWRPGGIAAALVAVHAASDLLSGYPHFVAGPDTPGLDLGLYYSAPQLAIVIEAGFAAAILAWVIRRERQHGLARGALTWAGRALVFGGGLATSFVTADGLGNLPPNGTLPMSMAAGLLGLYAGQIAVLTFTESRPPVGESTKQWAPAAG
ncbi:MAG: hypothetical protein AAGC67_13700 [Myxococcota bacterium]